MISCQEAIYRMQEALEGSPSTELYQHLSSCESCSTLWKALQTTHNLLQKYPHPLTVPPFSLKAGVMSAIKKEAARRRILKALAASLLIFSVGTALVFVLSSMAFKFWTLLPAARIVLEIALRWLWLCKGLWDLLIELVLVISRLALYPTAALVVLFAAFVVFVIKRWARLPAFVNHSQGWKNS